MSKYLNDLIKSLQAEAKEHEASLEQHAAQTRASNYMTPMTSPSVGRSIGLTRW